MGTKMISLKIDWKFGFKILISGLFLLFVTFVEPSSTFQSYQVAQAATTAQSPLLLEMSSPSDMLDEITSSSASKRVEGTADRVVGRAKRDISEVSGTLDKAEGLAQEAKGKAKQDVAKIQDKLEESGESLKSLSEDMVDAVKDAF